MKKRTKKSEKKIKSNFHIYCFAFFFFFVFLIVLDLYLITPTPVSVSFIRTSSQKYAPPIPFSQLLLDLQKKETPKDINGIVEGVFFHGARDKKRVALTFDADLTEGMHGMLVTGNVQSFYDDKLIAELRNTKTPATLFVTGKWIEYYSEIFQDLSNDPLFEIGSHSYAHLAFSSPCFYLAKLDENEKIKDIGTSQFLIEKYTGKKVTLFRFPGGCYSQSDVALIKKAGMIPVQWDVASHDGFNTNEEEITNNIVAKVRNGSIIVMHMNGFPNEPVDYIAVPHIIETLKSQGYEFVTVTQLLESYDIMK